MNNEDASRMVGEFQKMLDGIINDETNKILVIKYELAIAKPKETVDKICKFLELKSNEQQYKSAIDFIDSSLKTF